MTHTPTCWLIFGATYCGIAIGGIPGLTIDRTGIAVLGAIAMVSTGVLPLGSAMSAIDAPTLLLLFGLMIVSAQLRLSGFYALAAQKLSRLSVPPRTLLFLTMSVGAGLSAILVNDIVCLAFTPILTVAVIRAGLNPVPYLLGLACSSNIGSAATLIGNPQNMLLGQLGGLHFGAFLCWAIIPTLAALAAAYGILLLLYRGRLTACAPHPPPAEPHTSTALRSNWQMRKGLGIALLVIALFFTRIPRELSALVAGGLLLCSRHMDARKLLGMIDWSLIMLFCGLFIVIGGIESTGITEQLLDWSGKHGLNMKNPYALAASGALLSNIVSNVPAVMLLVRFMAKASTENWYVLAIASTFAGNLLTIGSIANLIVIEQARHMGVTVSFREHARAGIPVTLASLGIILLWIAARN